MTEGSGRVRGENPGPPVSWSYSFAEPENADSP